MRILFLAQIIPYPPDAGPKVKTWHVLRYLVQQGHEVTFVGFVRPDEIQHLPVLQELCAAVHTVPIHRSRLADMGYFLRSFITGRPFLVERDDLPGMRTLVNSLVSSQQFDVIHADQLTMVQFGLGHTVQPKPRLIFDAHNAVWTIVERMASNAAWFLKPALWIEAKAVKRYEGNLMKQVDRVLAVTDVDRDALLASLPPSQSTSSAPISVIPIAVDTHKLQPIARQPGSHNIFTLGTLRYPPNADGIRWFLNEVFPLIRRQIPDATLSIIGKDPPADFFESAAKYPGAVEITGYAPVLESYLEKSALTVVPVRAGGGMRVRILEAFAYAMPVVTTTIGLEGIQAELEKEVIVADEPDQFARRVIALLQDEKRQKELAENGRKLAEDRYDWQVVLGAMNEAYA
jgi:glycosyltransferase involved in cell wall biosynthesis